VKLSCDQMFLNVSPTDSVRQEQWLQLSGFRYTRSSGLAWSYWVPWPLGHSQALFSTQRRTYTIGNLIRQACSTQSLTIMPSSLVPSLLNLGNVSGSLGLRGRIAVGRPTAWRRGGPPHPDQCTLCDQEDETIQHILTTCVFARQFWFQILQPLNLGFLVPNRRWTSFADWWKRSWKRVPKQHKQGFNSLVIHGAWILWKHQNGCIFYGSAPIVQGALQAFQDEAQLWQFAGAKGLAALGSRQCRTVVSLVFWWWSYPSVLIFL